MTSISEFSSVWSLDILVYTEPHALHIAPPCMSMCFNLAYTIGILNKMGKFPITESFWMEFSSFIDQL